MSSKLTLALPGGALDVLVCIYKFSLWITSTFRCEILFPIHLVCIWWLLIEGMWPSVTVANCSLPFTFNGRLYEQCVQMVHDHHGPCDKYERCVQMVHDLHGPCDKFACVLRGRVWAQCHPPTSNYYLLILLLLNLLWSPSLSSSSSSLCARWRRRQLRLLFLCGNERDGLNSSVCRSVCHTRDFEPLLNGSRYRNVFCIVR